MVPIPTNPFAVVVITVPPVPTVILSPAAKYPLSKVNRLSVAKSPEFLNKTLALFPGGAIVTSTLIPGGGPAIPVAVTEFPKKFN